MQISDQCLALIKRCEGLVLTTYRDIVGLETIGYGHKLNPGERYPNGITEAQANSLLASDIATAEKQVLAHVHVPLSQGQFDALVSIVFNIGIGKMATSTLFKDLNSKQYDAAAEQLLRWDHAGLVEVKALKSRREAEYKLWHSAS